MPIRQESAAAAAPRPTILILGAGINGAALARDLVLSGAAVVVVDAGDVAAGATAWSTRLIHGGLRYLEYGEVGLVRESLVERDILLRAAPHLVRRLPFYVPLRGRSGGLVAAAARLVGMERLARRCRGPRGRGSWTLRIGLALYDLLAAGSGWPRHAIVRAGGPGLPRVDAARFPLAATYADGQALYPERLAVEFLVDARRVAAARGIPFAVHLRQRCRLGPDGGVRIAPADTDGGAPAVVWPAAIVNATGPWVDASCAELFAELAPAARPLTGGTKGSHLVIHSPVLREALGASGVYAEADDGRPVFVLPFAESLVLVGTTDLPFAGDPAKARADDDEIAYLLEAVDRLFPGVGITRRDVQHHYSGVRPLPAVAAAGGTPGAITRRHHLVRHASAPVPTWSIVGGKLTTCRSLAEATAATVLAAIGLRPEGSSRGRPLPGAWSAAGRAGAVAAALASAAAGGVAEPIRQRVAERLVDLFGARAADVWGRAATAALLDGVPLPAAAVAFCVEEEWARSIEDVVERRLMLVFDPALSMRTLADVAAALVAAGALPAAHVDTAVAAYAARLRDHFGRTLEPSP
jgi:glycerol-3-phosphate dehydrogenase